MSTVPGDAAPAAVVTVSHKGIMHYRYTMGLPTQVRHSSGTGDAFIRRRCNGASGARSRLATRGQIKRETRNKATTTHTAR